jgi:hypothetical protein
MVGIRDEMLEDHTDHMGIGILIHGYALVTTIKYSSFLPEFPLTNVNVFILHAYCKIPR